MKSSAVTQIQKAAIVLLNLNQDDAAIILQLLSEDEIREISIAMSNIKNIDSNTLNSVLEEFLQEFARGAPIGGNAKTSTELIEKALGKEKATAILEEAFEPKGKNVWDKLSSVSEDLIANYLRDEHPQTAAIVLSKLPTQNASKILSIFPDAFANDVVMRMINLGHVNKNTIEQVEKVLRNEFISSITKAYKKDGYEHVASIFNKFDRKSEEKFLKMLEDASPRDAEKVRSLMFTFNDLLKLDSAGIQAVIKEIDKNKLALALKGSTPDVVQLFLTNMSQRAAKIMQDEIDAISKSKGINEAQVEVINLVRKLIDAGEIEFENNKPQE